MNKSKQKVTKQQVKSMIQSAIATDLERKYWTVQLGTPSGPNSISSTGTIYSLSVPAQGSNNLNRIGNNAHVDELWGAWTLLPDSSDVQNNFRVTIVTWTDTTVCTTAQIYETTGNLINSYFNVNNIKTKKLKVLFDKKYAAAYGGIGSANEILRKKVALDLTWNSTSAVNAIGNDIIMCVSSDSTAVTHPTMTGSFCVMCSQ